MERHLLELAGLIALGIGATWLSWRLGVPSILLLLIAGFLAGPVAGVLDPDALLGDLLFPIVSLSVAIILFEGGLSLDIKELKDIGRVIRNLATIGVLVTWVGATALASRAAGIQFRCGHASGGNPGGDRPHCDHSPAAGTFGQRLGLAPPPSGRG